MNSYVLTNKRSGEKVFEGTSKECAFYLKTNTSTALNSYALQAEVCKSANLKNRAVRGLQVWKKEVYERRSQ